VEVLLSTLRPTELLAGKVLGIGLLGLGQLLIMSAVGVAGLLVTGSLALPAEAVSVIALVLVWYVLGYALYARSSP
jgi:ABC-2 type transport system permease protein